MIALLQQIGGTYMAKLHIKHTLIDEASIEEVILRNYPIKDLHYCGLLTSGLNDLLHR